MTTYMTRLLDIKISLHHDEKNSHSLFQDINNTRAHQFQLATTKVLTTLPWTKILQKDDLGPTRQNLQKYLKQATEIDNFFNLYNPKVLLGDMLSNAQETLTHFPLSDCSTIKEKKIQNYVFFFFFMVKWSFHCFV